MDKREIINTLIRIKELIELEIDYRDHVHEDMAIELIDKTVEKLR
jgi:hypothetical protein